MSGIHHALLRGGVIPPSFVGSSYATGNGASPDMPVGLQEGDLLLAIGVSTSSFYSVPYSFRSPALARGTGIPYLTIAYKIADGDEPSGGYSWGSSNFGLVALLAYRNVNPTYPIHQMSSMKSSTGSVLSTNQMTTTVGQTLILHVYGHAAWYSSWSSEPSGCTIRANLNLGFSSLLLIGEEFKQTAGLTTSRTASTGGATEPYHTIAIAINPSS